MQLGFVGESLFRRTQGQISEVCGHTSERETIQDGFELLMTIGGVRPRPSRLDGMS